MKDVVRVGSSATILNIKPTLQQAIPPPNVASVNVLDDVGAMEHIEDKVPFGKETRASSTVSDGNELGSMGVAGDCESMNSCRFTLNNGFGVVDTLDAATPMIAEMMICDFVRHEHNFTTPLSYCDSIKFQNAFAEDIGDEESTEKAKEVVSGSSCRSGTFEDKKDTTVVQDVKDVVMDIDDGFNDSIIERKQQCYGDVMRRFQFVQAIVRFISKFASNFKTAMYRFKAMIRFIISKFTAKNLIKKAMCLFKECVKAIAKAQRPY